MDVVGNNIANVNTTGFKSSRVTFKEMYSQSMRAASTPSPTAGGTGGTNPMQIGLGAMVGSIDMNMSPTAIESTGRKADMALDGKGYFILRTGDSTQHLYTRAGNFDLDGAGFLGHTATGNRLQGYMLTDPADKGSISGTLEDVQIPLNDSYPAVATTRAEVSGNLDSLTKLPELDENGEPLRNHSGALEVYDRLGQPHQIYLEYFKQESDPESPVWLVRLSMINKFESIEETEFTLNFDINGNLIGEGDERYMTVTLDNGGDGYPDQPDLVQTGGFTEPMEVVIDFGKITQFAGKTDAAAVRKDGNQAGKLTDWAIDQDGVLTLYYSNGERRNHARMALANFMNDAGLTKVSDTTFMESNNSGAAEVNIPNTGQYGKVLTSSIEMSNVDLAYEFTSMVITQRGYQANARVITTSDEILQELVNIKR